ncbi:MAG TPA: hypothetical protein VGK99_16615 [Acidobacteriota bacterium]|jgi:Tol biopolymer transport system component
MKKGIGIGVLTFFSLCAIALAAETAQELFQKALVKERAAGNLEEAIELYQRVARESRIDRALAAKALLAAGRCYEKLGGNRATRLYEEVAQKYADQPEQAAAARSRLAALASSGKPKILDISAGLLGRQISVPPHAMYPYSDGSQTYYVDTVSDSLLSIGLGGTRGRLIFRRPPDCECGNIRGFSVSPDGKQIAMSLDGLGKPAFGFVQTDGTGFRLFHKKRVGAMQPVWGWSPDSTRVLASIREDDGSFSLVSFAVRDGSFRKLANFSQSSPRGAKYSPDGNYVACTLVQGDPGPSHVRDEEEVLLMAADGSNLHKLVENSGANRFLDWTTDGRSVLYMNARSGSQAIYALPVSAGKANGVPILITRIMHPAQSASMTRDGTLLYTGVQTRDDIYRVKLDPNSGKMLGDPEPVSNRLFDTRYTGTWSRDGRYLAYVNKKGSSTEVVLTIQEIESGVEREIALPNLRVPDASNRPPIHNVMLSQNAVPIALVWSPEGAELYFAFNDSDTQAISVQRVSMQSGECTQLVKLPKSPIAELSPIGRNRRVDDMWVSSGGLLIRFSDPVGRQRYRTGLLRLDLATLEVTEIISKDIAYEIALSPDGRRAAALDGMQQRTISTKETAGGDWKVIATMPAGAVLDLRWMPDGTSLRFIEETPAGAILWRIPAEGGEMEKLGETTGLMHMHRFQVHPDGTQALFHTQLVRAELWAIGNFLPKLNAAH